MTGFEVIKAKELKKAIKHFGKKTIPDYMKTCNDLTRQLDTSIERFKKLFINPSDKMNEDLSTWDEKVIPAIRSQETKTALNEKATPTQTTPDKVKS